MRAVVWWPSGSAAWIGYPHSCSFMDPDMHALHPSSRFCNVNYRKCIKISHTVATLGFKVPLGSINACAAISRTQDRRCWTKWITMITGDYPLRKGAGAFSIVGLIAQKIMLQYRWVTLAGVAHRVLGWRSWRICSTACSISQRPCNPAEASLCKAPSPSLVNHI